MEVYMGEYKSFLDNDIRKLESALNAKDSNKVKSLIKAYAVAYQTTIPAIESVWDNINGWGYEPLDEAESAIHSMKAYMYGFKGASNAGGTNVNVKNENKAVSTSSVSNNVMIDINFHIETVRDEIENSPYIGECQRKEIFEKLAELDTISKSDDNNVKKWSKLKPFTTWMSTQGVDVAIKLLPIVLKLIENGN